MLYPSPTWQILNAVALVAALGLCVVAGGAIGAFLRRARRELRDGRSVRAVASRIGTTKGLLAIFATLYGAGILSWGFFVITFDRYLWLLVLPLYALLLARPDADEPASTPAAAAAAAATSPGRISIAALPGALAVGLSAILLAGLAATSLVLLANANAFEAARWRMGELAVARGIPAGTVDAGLEWVAFHATGVAKPYAKAPAGWSRYEAWWPSFRLCAMASTSPIDRPDLTLIEADAAAYRLLLWFGPNEPLYLYRAAGAGCP